MKLKKSNFLIFAIALVLFNCSNEKVLDDISSIIDPSKYCEELGLSPAETMQAQVESFKFVGETNGIEFDQYIIDPYKEFLMGKSTLVITAQPTQPIAFSQIDLYAPSDVPALLNLAAVAR